MVFGARMRTFLKPLRVFFHGLIALVVYLFVVTSMMGAAPLVHAVPPPSDGFVLTQWGAWTPQEAIRALDQAHAAGARHISVLVMLCQSSQGASDIHFCEAAPGQNFQETSQGKRLSALLPEFEARGLSLGLIPFPRAAGLSSRQWIWPKDPKSWFRNYGDLLVDLGGFAREAGATELVVGSELTRLFTLEKNWRAVIQRVRGVFSGHLTLSPFFLQYQRIRFWDALDSVGVSFYFPLSLRKRRGAKKSVDELERALRWHRGHLVPFAKKVGKPLTFVEVGYPATEVAAARPWDFQFEKRQLDLAQQARCFEAFRRVFSKEPLLRGFQIWGLSGQAVNPKAFEPLGKPAEIPVRKLFEERAGM